MISKRRRDDDSDDLATFFGLLPDPPETETDIEQTDDLGRAIPKPNPVDERRQRRVSRVARRQLRSSNWAKTAEVEEGYSTDSSLAPHDASAYSSALQSLASRKKDVLADVRAEEFRDPGKGRWSVWREKYSDSYVGAWGGLGVVSVWEFWVRLESVGWNCIEVRAHLFLVYQNTKKIKLTMQYFRINAIYMTLNGIKAFMNIAGLGRVLQLRTESSDLMGTWWHPWFPLL